MLGLMRRNPTLNLSPFSEVDRFFDDLFSSFSLTNASLGVPSADIFYNEDDRNMVVELQVPGFDRDNIQVSIDKGVLEIRGQREYKEEEGEKRNYVVRENSLSFARRIVLPEGADTERISAELDKGVLKVIVPVEQREAKRVEIAAPKSSGKAKLAATTAKQEETA